MSSSGICAWILKFEPKALAVLSRSFVEMKTLPSEPDMKTLTTEAFLPNN